MDTVIKNAYVITADSEDHVYENGCVWVKDKRIHFVGDMADAPDTDGARMIDAHGAAVLPGFINTHTHIPMSLLRGIASDLPLKAWLEEKIYPAEAKLTGEAVYWGSMLSILEMLAGGITCFSDMYFFSDDIAKAVHKSGIRAFLSSAIIDSVPGGDKRLARAVAFHRDWDGRGNIRVTMAPHAEYTVSADLFRKIRHEAEKHKMRIHIHVSETEQEHKDCIKRNGKTPVGWLNGLGLLDLPVMAAHCVHVEDADMDIMAEKNVSVLSCPQSNLKLASGVAPLQRMIKKGITVSLGTDGAASNDNQSMMEEMTLASLLQKGVYRDAENIPARKALRMATIAGAEALGIAQETGSIETGKRADIVLLKTNGVRYTPKTDTLNNIVYSGSDHDIYLTMVNGEILYENGVYAFIDAGEVKEKANQYAAKILG